MRILSSVYGKIKRLLLIIPLREPGASITADFVPDQFGRLFDALSDRVTFVVLSNFDFGGMPVKDGPLKGIVPNRWVLDQAFPCRVEMLDLSYFPEFKEGQKDHFPSRWAQDPFCVMADGDRCLLLEPYEFAHRANQLIADHLSGSLGIPLLNTRYFLEGGNILVGDDYALIGKNLLMKNIRRYCPGESIDLATKSMHSAFCELLGVDHIHWVGLDRPAEYKTKLNAGEGGFQPLFHIDLFVTLAGPSKYTQGKELVFVAELQPEDLESISDPKTREDLEALNRHLQFVADSLEGKNTEVPEHVYPHKVVDGPEFDVVRLPMVAKESPKGPVLFSFNNCLVEVYRHTKRVYLPLYDGLFQHEQEECPCAQCKVDRMFSSRGFRTVFVDGCFRDFASEQGSLHCMTKVLWRQL